jgi:hypothetical protein
MESKDTWYLQLQEESLPKVGIANYPRHDYLLKQITNGTIFYGSILSKLISWYSKSWLGKALQDSSHHSC